MALVSMPFGPLFYPSIALSLLKAALTRESVSSRLHYFTIDFAQRVGSRLYRGVSDGNRPQLRHLPGEWIFSGALFPATEDDERRYIETNLKRKPGKTSPTRKLISRGAIDDMLRARRAVDAFLDDCVDRVLLDRPRIVGFTSVFQQHTASLALAQRIKAASPETFIVIGGANCEGIMGAETVRQFPFVDATVSGEGDLIFPELVKRVLASQSLDGLPGVRTRTSIGADFAKENFGNAPTVMRMDELPYPDYDEFFEQFAASRYGRKWQPGIFFETSRGCWWGEKQHCTFCGLNGGTMTFRSKSATRSLEELEYLTNRHEGADVEMTDNILDLAYFKDFVPELAKRGGTHELFYEVKSNLRKEQVRMLRDAGIRRIQPGIESLSDSVLKLMRKGVSALQNIQLLKWCKELGVSPLWNLLWGFPGESPEAYSWMARVAPLLTHLRPPISFATIRLDRFSPNFFDAEKLGFTGVQPIDAYRHIYKLPDEAIFNLAYYFSFRYQVPQDLDMYAQPLAIALRDWRRLAGRSDLFSIDTGDHLIIWDLRPIATRSLTVLPAEQRLLYLACDAVTDARQLATQLSRTVEEITSALAPLLEQGLILQDGARYLALAVPLGDYTPDRPIVERFYGIIRNIAEPSRRGIAVRWSGSARPRRSPAARLPRMTRRPLTTSQFSIDGNHVVIH
ncbi:MAG TPA: RiPP maturation radical SAM C-methyltransferase [Thermoanaerobaculia bacterium]|nr:RiPP maturation radical SAM C-methyltransferase [Thermoanaerobaculia bacterium]